MHEGNRSAFTLIEFVIAVAVAVILVSVGIPRYNSFIQRQDFVAGLQSISSCIQQAQQGAVAPANQFGSGGNAVRFTEARIIQGSGTTSVTCEVHALDAADAAINTIPVSSFQGDKVSLVSLTADGGTVQAFAGETQIFFGTLENGAPVTLYNGNTVVKNPPDPPYGRGFTLVLNANSSEISTLSGALTMERLGTPVQISLTP